MEAAALWASSMRGIVNVVTGAGKTIFAQICMSLFIERYPEGRITIIVPTIVLLDQWFVSLVEDLGVPPSDIACFSGEGHAEAPRLINIAVINTARRVPRELAGQAETFLIVDECHRAGAPVNARALAGTHRASLGLSATPEREYDDGYFRYLVPTLGEIIYTYDYPRARRDGVVVPFELVNVRVQLLPSEQKEYDDLTRRIARTIGRVKEGRAPMDLLKSLLRRRASVGATASARIPVTAKLVESHRGARTIVFHERIPAANAIVRVLSARRLSPTAYHTQIPGTVRRDNLRLYRRGLFDILVCCRALDEGINVPETSVAIVASSTASVRQRIQRLGRVLRPSHGKKTSTVYTIYATPAEEERLQVEAAQLREVARVSWLQAEGLPGRG